MVQEGAEKLTRSSESLSVMPNNTVRVHPVWLSDGLGQSYLIPSSDQDKSTPDWELSSIRQTPYGGSATVLAFNSFTSNKIPMLTAIKGDLLQDYTSKKLALSLAKSPSSN